MKKTSSLIACSFAFLFMICLNSCDKTSDLEKCKADPTCEYFRCNVDGKPWKPYCESSFLGCDAVDVQYYRNLNGGGLELNARNEKHSNGFYFSLKNIKEENFEYSFDQGSNIVSRYVEDEDEDGTKERYFIDFSKDNSIIFSRIDSINFILEGEFHFIGKTESGAIKEITEGQFRQHYRF